MQAPEPVTLEEILATIPDFVAEETALPSMLTFEEKLLGEGHALGPCEYQGIHPPEPQLSQLHHRGNDGKPSDALSVLQPPTAPQGLYSRLAVSALYG